ncbi:hypothetical protein LA303_13055 [Candidatus Sulfidibacterium hydrothermale]|uniref:hypothetical protein n=1 Tax=Candidatus Sulfidibacterium hydrothermale TaxID=2875962 RepID=UPI001F0A73C7|nr:hypothetical protein [Candidatus Sulfidibacterium hydrothermale]UBM62309.1 hypothetical protein LA303_13055 [Candidatus Sulfidibacterium hydrothermale]
MKSQLFTDILQDNFSGSGAILDAVQKQLNSFPPEQSLDIPDILKQLDKLEQTFPHFALLYHFLKTLRHFLSNKNRVQGVALKQFVEQYRKKWENTQQKAAENFLENTTVSGKNILLHSNSSAIRQLFSQMASARLFPEIWQTVSSPVNEGILQAVFLEKLGFRVHLFHEDSISQFVRQIDFALFGADLWWDNYFLNKIGTFPLALFFHHFNKPVYVLAEKRKKIALSEISEKRFQQMIHENPKPAKEILPQTENNIQVHNFYFEIIPSKFVTRFFTEE